MSKSAECAAAPAVTVAVMRFAVTFPGTSTPKVSCVIFPSALIGVMAGACACVPIYVLLAKPERIGRELAAPSAVAWAAVAKLLKDGPSNLPQLALEAAIVGAVIGVVLASFEELAPEKWKTWIPSATGVGIAFVIDANDSIAMFMGAMLTVLARRFVRDGEKYRVPAASGMVAGEGLMGIAVIVLRDVLHLLPRG